MEVALYRTVQVQLRLYWRKSNIVNFNDFCTTEIVYFTLAIHLLQKSNENPTETNKNILYNTIIVRL
jgi:hypothetical protein